MENVVWTSLVNVAATGNSLQKNGGSNGSDDAGAASQQQVASGTACLEVTASELTTGRVVGLSNGNPGTTVTEIDYGIWFTTGGDAEVREGGAWKGGTTSQTGTVFKIVVEGSTVKYYKGATLFHT